MASKFFTHKKSLATLSEVNVIPLVDIVFTLLIIFMILAPMIHKGIEVQVPESSVGETVSDQEQHIVSINRDGQIWFDDREVFPEEIQTQLQAFSEDDTIYVQADKGVPYGVVVDLISEIKESGIRNVGLVTSPRPARKDAEYDEPGTIE